MENDFEGGEFDSDGEFYFKENKKNGGANKRQKMTKEDHIYGDFYQAPPGDNDEDEIVDEDDFESVSGLRAQFGGVQFVNSKSTHKKK